MKGNRRKKKTGSGISKRIVRLLIFAIFIMLGITVYEWWKERKAIFLRYPEFGIEIPVEYNIHGIDVSRYQQQIDWEEVRNMQVENIKLGFAFIKATEGIKNRDPNFRRNWKKAKDAGIIRGAYHFFLTTKSGRLQAENFIKNVELMKGDLPPVLDVEVTYGVPAKKIREEVKIWLNIVEQHYRVKPIIYTNVSFYNHYLGEKFDEYPLWVAHYLQKKQPRISRDWHFWQYSETGRVNGIRGNVDFNVFRGDSTDFRSLLVNEN